MYIYIVYTCTHSCQQIWFCFYQKHFLSVVLSAFIQFSFTLIHMYLLYILMLLFLFFLFVLKFMLSYYFLAICLNFLFLFFFFFAGILTFCSASFGERRLKICFLLSNIFMRLHNSNLRNKAQLCIFGNIMKIRKKN